MRLQLQSGCEWRVGGRRLWSTNGRPAGPHSRGQVALPRLLPGSPAPPHPLTGGFGWARPLLSHEPIERVMQINRIPCLLWQPMTAEVQQVRQVPTLSSEKSKISALGIKNWETAGETRKGIKGMLKRNWWHWISETEAWRIARGHSPDLLADPLPPSAIISAGCSVWCGHKPADKTGHSFIRRSRFKVWLLCVGGKNPQIQKQAQILLLPFVSSVVLGNPLQLSKPWSSPRKWE